jgi:hypothetical protein
LQPFEFVLVLVSIILGLGLTDLLAMLARTLRREVKSGPVHSLWALYIGLLILQQFWSKWTHQSLADWSVVELGLFLAPSFLAFLAASLVSPSRVDDVEMDQYFLARRKPVFVVLALLMISYSFEEWFLTETVTWTSDLIRLLSVALFAIPFVFEQKRIQLACALAATALLVTFTFGWTFTLAELAAPTG